MSTIAVEAKPRPVRTREFRPDLHNMHAYPHRRVSAGAVRGARACRVAGVGSSKRSQRPARGGLLLTVKLAAVTALAAVGGVVGVSGYVSAVAEGHAPEPATQAAAWVHVEP